MKCQHPSIRIVREEAFVGPLGVLDEEPRAHGGVQITERCADCGAERTVNANQGFREEGPWETQAYRRLADIGVHVLGVQGGIATVQSGPFLERVTVASVRAAAHQSDAMAAAIYLDVMDRIMELSGPRTRR